MKKDGKASNADAIGELAAESTQAFNPLIGISKKVLTRSLGIFVSECVKNPSNLGRHYYAYSKDMLRIIKGESDVTVDARDRRFSDQKWKTNPVYKRVLQSYVAFQNSLSEWLDESNLEKDDKERVRFLMSIVVDSLAPTNTLIGNPTALQKALDTKGQSLIDGLKNAYDDIVNNGGMPAQVDKRPFKIGENVAVTPGEVIFKNEILELIQYTPQTKTVAKTPVLIVPPQINKFYAYDIEPSKSIVQYLLSQGLQVFIVSYFNPGKAQAHWGLADYIDAIIEAVEAILSVTRQDKVTLVGACSGGITATSVAHALQARGMGDAVNAMALLVCVLKPNIGDTELSLFASKEAIEAARNKSKKAGILSGNDLGSFFAWMRPNDLIWNYVVNNYLLGEDPPAFDVLFWNNDVTNLPAQLHSDFLDLGLDERFSNPGTVDFMGDTVDLSKMNFDILNVAGSTDHITPWRSCYRSNDLFGGNVEFVLVNSGHLQAMIMPIGKPRAKYFVNKGFKGNDEDWLQGSEAVEGSWWPYLSEWLLERSGDEKAAPKSMGNKSFAPLYPAPGKNVLIKA